MEHAPHTPLKNRFKEYVAPKMGLTTPPRYDEDQAGQARYDSNGDLVHISPPINALPGSLIATLRKQVLHRTVI
jgi:hypothetical protein